MCVCDNIVEGEGEERDNRDEEDDLICPLARGGAWALWALEVSKGWQRCVVSVGGVMKVGRSKGRRSGKTSKRKK